MAKNWDKHNQERDRLMKMVPKKLPKAINEWLDSHCLDKQQYIFYDRKNHYAYCTRCHQQIDGRLLPTIWAKHGDIEKCPSCGGLAEYKCIGKFRKRNGLMKFDEFQVKIIQKTNEGIVFRRFRIIRECHKDRFNRAEEKWYWDELQRIFNDGMQVKNYRAMPSYDYKTGEYTSYWNKSKKTDYETIYSIGWVKSLQSYDYDANLKSVIKGTPWQYAKSNMDLEYYAAWIKPVEYLEKSGWTSLARDILSFDTRWLNVKATSLDKFLRLEKHAIKYARDAKLGITGLNALRICNRRGGFLPDPVTFNDFVNRFQWVYQTAIKLAPSIKLQDWFKFQNKLFKSGTSNHYTDYLRFCSLLGYDMTDPNILYPKDIRAAHDREMARVKTKEDKALGDAIKSRYKKDHLKLSFSSDNYLIRPPKDMKELLNEGSSLNHCVGTYADRVARHETTILFIRAADHPENSFYTLEFRNGKIVQCRGFRNCDMTEEVKEFVENWKKHLKSNKRKPAAISAAV